MTSASKSKKENKYKNRMNENGNVRRSKRQYMYGKRNRAYEKSKIKEGLQDG